ncbi:AAA family ATPase [Bradyrhizobium sp. Arg237L]|uniref:AAA family ATPase n=1 Tax=Bradyrhizobium sp. Arg237L TaxID=3003352 RepID=UPI00249F6535|nr:AAA family ATPase [Bradyrhizobium sp. Arg237L]MDI4236806.1 AAA family ATPase [Bradyrhizobium sp. Arg237L]
MIKSNVVQLPAAEQAVREQARIDKTRELNKQVALDLIAAGIPVFLTNPETKRPYPTMHNRLDSEIPEAEKEASRRAFYDKHRFHTLHVGATLDRKEVRRMFREKPDALAAISCGPAGLIVVDNDIKPRNGVLRNGVELFDSFCEPHGGIPERAVIVPSRNKGRHIYFKNDEERGCSAGRLKRDCESDVKGVGGYVIAPASVRIHDGRAYGTRENLDALISAYKQNALIPVPSFISDAIGAKSEHESNTTSERDVQDGIASLRVADLPDGDDLLDPSKGGFDIEEIAGRYPKLRAALDDATRSDIRFNLAVALKTERPSLTVEEFAAILIARDDVGDFVEDEKPSPDGGEYNWRNIVRDFKRAAPSVKPDDKGPSTGVKFGNVEGIEEAEERAESEAALSKLDVLTKHLEAAIANADLEGDELLVDALEEQLRNVQKQAAKVAKGGRIDYVNLPDLLAEPETYTQWVVKHFVAFNTTIIAAGRWGTGKTAVYLDIALHIAHGMPWRDRKVEKGIVVYAALENPKDVQSRIRAWCKRNMPEGQFEPSFVLYRGDCSLFDPRDKATEQEKSIIKLANDTAKKLGLPVAMVVIDTVAQAILPGNDREHGSLFVRSMQRIANATGANVTALHHPTKAGDEVRGDGAFQGNTDGVVLLARDTSTGVGTIKASAQKFRVGDPRKVNFGYKLHPVVVGKDEEGEDRTVIIAIESAVGGAMGLVTEGDDTDTDVPMPDNPSDRVEATLRVIRDKVTRILDEGGGTIGEIRLTRRDIHKALNIDRERWGLKPITEESAVSRMLAVLVERGDLVREGENRRSMAYRLAV